MSVDTDTPPPDRPPAGEPADPPAPDAIAPNTTAPDTAGDGVYDPLGAIAGSDQPEPSLSRIPAPGAPDTHASRQAGTGSWEPEVRAATTGRPDAAPDAAPPVLHEPRTDGGTGLPSRLERDVSDPSWPVGDTADAGRPADSTLDRAGEPVFDPLAHLDDPEPAPTATGDQPGNRTDTTTSSIGDGPRLPVALAADPSGDAVAADPQDKARVTTPGGEPTGTDGTVVSGAARAATDTSAPAASDPGAGPTAAAVTAGMPDDQILDTGVAGPHGGRPHDRHDADPRRETTRPAADEPDSAATAARPGHVGSGPDTSAEPAATPRADAMRGNRPDGIPPGPWNRMCDGVAFDEQRRPYYTARGGGNEISLDNGKRLDSYLPGKEIISRKYTQLAQVQPDTAIGYLRELDRKYSPNETVKDTPRNRAQLPDEVGWTIQGAPILEVPPQHADAPRSVLEEAERLGITIRDCNGTVYELP